MLAKHLLKVSKALRGGKFTVKLQKNRDKTRHLSSLNVISDATQRQQGAKFTLRRRWTTQHHEWLAATGGRLAGALQP